MTQSHGHVAVETELGLGSTFKVYLPLVEEPADETALTSVGEAVVDGSETILVVEDEDMVRDLVCSVLRKRGYDVLVASNGSEALAMLRDHEETIHLLLTDVVMPRMSGLEVARHVKAARPEVKILYMSGYTDGTIGEEFERIRHVGFIQKPFDGDMLLRRIYEVLHASENAASGEIV